MSKKILFGTFLLLAVFSGAMVAYAASSFQQTITWTKIDESIVYPSNAETITYGNVEVGTVRNETYTVINNGNVPVTVEASHIVEGAVAEWNATSATITPGEAATFNLTLTILDTGSCQVYITKNKTSTPFFIFNQPNK